MASKVLIIATNGFEQSELLKPPEALEGAGIKTALASPESGQIKGWNHTDWGESVPVDLDIEDVQPSDFDALLLRGGQMNPDLLRQESDAIAFIRGFWKQNKVIAAICHAPWLLIEAGLVRGRNVTSYLSIRTDVINAGGIWHDEDVVVDEGLVTSRKPTDLESFCLKTAEEIAEGKHERRAA